jgi:hypothetical protein
MSNEATAYSRWPLGTEERQVIIQTLLELVNNGSAQHRIRAAKVLLEIDQKNRHNEVAIDVDHLRQILADKRAEEAVRNQQS